MKFSTSLDFNSHPNWKDSYINYERLKKVIYAKEIEETRGHSLAITGSDNRTSLGEDRLPLLCPHVSGSTSLQDLLPSVSAASFLV